MRGFETSRLFDKLTHMSDQIVIRCIWFSSPMTPEGSNRPADLTSNLVLTQSVQDWNSYEPGTYIFVEIGYLVDDLA
jgi:hypothetical protein